MLNPPEFTNMKGAGHYVAVRIADRQTYQVVLMNILGPSRSKPPRGSANHAVEQVPAEKALARYQEWKAPQEEPSSKKAVLRSTAQPPEVQGLIPGGEKSRAAEGRSPQKRACDTDEPRPDNNHSSNNWDSNGDGRTSAAKEAPAGSASSFSGASSNFGDGNSLFHWLSQWLGSACRIGRI
eukprot:2449738-Pyramimonas_sp.AAC.1